MFHIEKNLEITFTNVEMEALKPRWNRTRSPVSKPSPSTVLTLEWIMVQLPSKAWSASCTEILTGWRSEGFLQKVATAVCPFLFNYHMTLAYFLGDLFFVYMLFLLGGQGKMTTILTHKFLFPFLLHLTQNVMNGNTTNRRRRGNIKIMLLCVWEDHQITSDDQGRFILI